MYWLYTNKEVENLEAVIKFFSEVFLILSKLYYRVLPGILKIEVLEMRTPRVQC
jgi:hypothetical protein